MKKIYFTAMALLGWAAGSYGQVPEIEDDVNIYPDPANKTLKVVYTSAEKMPLNIKIVNQTGITVYSETLSDGKERQVKVIDMAMQAGGTYTVRTENQNMMQAELITLK